MPNLKSLAREINNLHRQVNNTAKATIIKAREAGECLLEAREKCKHGEWLPWLDSNFEGSRATAYNYMSVAQNWLEIEINFQRVGNLGMAQVLALLKPAPKDSVDFEDDFAPPPVPHDDKPAAKLNKSAPDVEDTEHSVLMTDPDAWRADTPAPTPPPKPAPPTVEDAKVKSEAIKESPPPPKPKPNPHEEEVRQLAYFKKAVPALVKYLTDGSSNLSSLIISINTINGGADFSTLSDFALAFECLSDRLLRGLRSTGDVRLAPPTTQDVADYAKSARLKDHAEDFCDFFDSNGWLVSGKTPMKDWKATYRRWCRNAPRFSNGQDAKAQRRTTEWV